MLGVVTGLKSEAKLLHGLGLACISTGGKAHIARAKIDRLIARGVRGLVSFGIAGALSPELKSGDLVIADAIANDVGEVWQAHRPWVDALLSGTATERNNRRHDDVPHHAAARRSEGHSAAAPLWANTDRDWEDQRDARAEAPSPDRHLGLEPGPMVTTSRNGGRMGPGSRRFAAVRDSGGSVRVGAILALDRMLSSPQEKAAAFARSGALAVDMESHHVARAAAERNLPFVAVRAISDEAHEALPAIMVTFVDEFGQTRTSAVLAALILGRTTIPKLLIAGLASRRALRSLSRALPVVSRLA